MSKNVVKTIAKSFLLNFSVAIGFGVVVYFIAKTEKKIVR